MGGYGRIAFTSDKFLLTDVEDASSSGLCFRGDRPQNTSTPVELSPCSAEMEPRIILLTS